jgi:hypothetical protein
LPTGVDVELALVGEDSIRCRRMMLADVVFGAIPPFSLRLLRASATIPTLDLVRAGD